jgi:hypothetical protein
MSVPEIPQVFEPTGSCLYHYTRLDTALELILPTWRIRLSPFSKMRDPRESKRWGYEAPRAPSMDLRDEVTRFSELIRLANELPDRVKVLSLTQDDVGERDTEAAVFGRGFAHPRLWEQYADKHSGICLCFDRQELTRTLTIRLRRSGPVEHGPVEYADREIAPDALRFLIKDSRDLPLVEALHSTSTLTSASSSSRSSSTGRPSPSTDSSCAPTTPSSCL